MKSYENYKNKEKKVINIQPAEQTKKEILGKCIICDKNVSDPYYSFNIEEQGYIHFECLIKHVKEIAYNMRLKNFKILYLGGKKFGIINDRQERGESWKWNIIKKIEVQEILENLRKEDINSKY